MFGLKAGEAWDLITGWDFTKADHREKALKYVDEVEPLFVIGSPPHVHPSVNSNP